MFTISSISNYTLSSTREFQNRTPMSMSHHIDFSEHPLKKNYIGTLKHHLFEHFMQIFSDYQTNQRSSMPTKNMIKRETKRIISENGNLLKYRHGATPAMAQLWKDIKPDFYYFVNACRDFALSYINTNQGIRFRTHLGTLAELKIRNVEHTELAVKSQIFGLKGKIDVIFRCWFYPDVVRNPERRVEKMVIADLMTGEFTKKNNHQILYYMMTYFEEDIDGQIGMVMYSKSKTDSKGFTLDFVYPYKQYFTKLLVHRNLFAIRNTSVSSSQTR